MDAAVAAHGPQAAALYSQGRQATAPSARRFQCTDGGVEGRRGDRRKLEIDRRQLPRYADFPLDKYIQKLRATKTSDPAISMNPPHNSSSAVGEYLIITKPKVLLVIDSIITILVVFISLFSIVS